MTTSPASSQVSRRLHGPRDPGDAWVYSETGQRYWGRFGAAGLVAVDPQRGILLQHRAEWSHHGGTWGIPGGALHEGELPAVGALREAAEEAGVPADAVAPLFTSVLELGFWRYTTLVARVTDPFDPVIADAESLELRWVPIDDVDALPLHHGFAASWPGLRSALAVRPTIIVDAANVVGSVPDGWWRDRVGAAERLLAKVHAFALAGSPDAASRASSSDFSPGAPSNSAPSATGGGISADELGLAGDRWFPEFAVVVEGAARDARCPAASESAAHASVSVVRAAASGDDAIVDEARRRLTLGESVTVVTSDRELGERVTEVGANVQGVAWLREMVGYGARR
ncbi:NUDIX domain-containing protein [Pseudoclavibacter helvolus]|uniref:NUDIX domain-containing protein n=1 Tax=Pseudoclavibacter helvolus TaxID=255205 RepID=UPI0024AD266A|nr:NUDIX hydrolase [Pseudoclavibacter helvolus]